MTTSAPAPTLQIVLSSALQTHLPFLEERLPGHVIVVAQPGTEAFRLATRDADAAVGWGIKPVDLADARRLRLVQLPVAGFDSFDLSALPHGCALCSNHAHAWVVAEWTMMLMLASAKRLIKLDTSLRNGTWLRLEGNQDLGQKTLGVVGLGPIGRRVTQLGAAFNMRVLAVTHRPDPERAATVDWLGGLDELDFLMAESDYVALCLQSNASTESLVGERQLELLGPRGHLVNTARGKLVDETALFAALRDGTIAGAAIDAWRHEPRPGDATAPPGAPPFHELENVTMTPHLAGVTEGGLRSRLEFVALQLQRLADGRPLENVEAIGA